MDPIKIIIVLLCIENFTEINKNNSFGILKIHFEFEFISWLCYGFCYLAEFICGGGCGAMIYIYMYRMEEKKRQTLEGATGGENNGFWLF